MLSIVSRRGLLGIVGLVWVLGLAALLGMGMANRPEPVTVVHWANSHMMREPLLPQMAARFNGEGHRTAAGRPIRVAVYGAGSAQQVDDLVSRVARGAPVNGKLPDPTIVTPQADHWLVAANHAAGRPLVDLASSQAIARTWIGIVTYREMAECLGWPQREVGYAEVVALRSDPQGWAKYPCAKAEWGQKPLVAFTDPLASSTGRSVLFTLYAIAAGKTPEQLTVADVADPAVRGYVRQFQGLVDHYLPGTIPLNTQVHQGPRYGHFFLMPEDNLVHLYEGTERAVVGGKPVQAPPIKRPMVMLYPKEGSAAHTHSAHLVQAPWVTAEQREAAKAWATFLRHDAQQRAFMAAGFRPGTQLPVTEPISGRYGLDAAKPATVVNPDRIDAGAAAEIVRAWDEVKKPGVVTFVADVSGSMAGDKLEQARQGLTRALDGMSQNNRVGLVLFGTTVATPVSPAPLPEVRFSVASFVERMRAGGNTALYDAIKTGIEMTDAAPGDDDAIRGVVVLTDGRANAGKTRLDELIQMTGRGEVPIRQFGGFDKDAHGIDESGRPVEKQALNGAGMALHTRHPIQVFYVGIGADADMEVGRLLAEATGAAFQGAAEKDLANVLVEFGKYF